ncbi:unnamed protein product [Cylicocyclus nassatus]|uniref:Uncharacterized protein n=1 Tax=Cylicocyclus nassatus TaxID=53992 RepID=A0AA36M498_CYLNA|nr:unnamed protein product [Cylicocyclus nassatus]
MKEGGGLVAENWSSINMYAFFFLLLLLCFNVNAERIRRAPQRPGFFDCLQHCWSYPWRQIPG